METMRKKMYKKRWADLVMSRIIINIAFEKFNQQREIAKLYKSKVRCVTKTARVFRKYISRFGRVERVRNRLKFSNAFIFASNFMIEGKLEEAKE